MTTSITTIQSSDLITNSRADINNNFSSLNSNKIETSVIDTDTTLAANSDSKLATQKAVKAYVDSGGNPNASETVRGIVEEATDAEVTAGTATGSTGAKLFVTPAKLNTLLAVAPVVRTYTAGSTVGSTSTRFDITNPSGTTFRYTYDGTGTDPVINTSTFPVGMVIQIFSQSFNVNNNGTFIVTGSSTNYFEVTNASGVAENDKILNTDGFLLVGQTWTKPTGLKYAVVEVQGAGAYGGAGVDGGASDTPGAGGGAGGYSKKTIAAATLGATESLQPAKSLNANGFDAMASRFGSHLYTTRAQAGSGNSPGDGGVGVNGDINVSGGDGHRGSGQGTGNTDGGNGGSAFYGGGGSGGSDTTGGAAGNNYGGGGGGGGGEGGQAGGAGSAGIIIVTEYYN